MTMYDYINRKVPAYYNTMYLDGYTPYEILYAKRQTLLTPKEEQNLNAVIEAALNDIFKDWQ